MSRISVSLLCAELYFGGEGEEKGVGEGEGGHRFDDGEGSWEGADVVASAGLQCDGVALVV